MHIVSKMILALLAATLMLPLLSLGFDQVENRPAETAAENLYNKGIGNAWVSGEPFSSDASATNGQAVGERHIPEYQIIGYLNSTSGLIIAGDSNSMRFNPGPGNFPVYGYFEGDKMTGIYIDFGISY
jgi:hypothetical protein